jgi:HK97 family phage portal protein
MRSVSNGAEDAKGHPLWALETIEPSPMITAFNFRRDMFADACFGNAYAKISFKGNGRAYKLERLIPEDVTIYEDINGALYYLVTRRNRRGPNTEVLYQYEVIHLRGMTLDGWQGLDVSNTFGSSLAMSIEATRYGHNFFSNNAAVDSVIEYPGPLSPQQREIMESKIKQKHAGISNVGGTMLLDAGSKFNKIGLNPQEAMLNDTRMFQAYESCRIFGVPAHMINVLDRSTFNNIEMMDNGFVKYCLAPWAQQFEAEHDVKLLTSDEKTSGSVFHRFDLSGLMRGDMKSRGEYEDKMLKNMVWTINDVRRGNDMNTVPWGDRPYAQAGVTPVNEDGSIDLNTPADQNQANDANGATDNSPQPQA